MSDNEKQDAYEIRRRARQLGLNIDQCLTGLKGIIVFSADKFWPDDIEAFCRIRNDAEDLLVEMMKLERRLSAVVMIYATFNPANPETHTIPPELEVK